MNTLDEATFVQEICRQLDASIAHLPDSTARHLTASRQAAVMQQAHPNTQDEMHLAGAVSRQLDNGNTVPPEIEARLDQIRQSAVAKFELQQDEKQQSSGFAFGAWLRTQLDSFNFSTQAGMLTTACVLVTAISLFYVNTRSTGTLTLEEEISLVATAEDIELYENLEFYLWLAENESLTL